ncbi:MAG TPA: O-antigen ligase family protein [Acidimicrobiales bacterium]
MLAAAAAAVGAALALDPLLALGLAAAAAFGVALWYDLRLAIVLWLPLTFLDGVPAANAAGKAGGALIALGWVACWPHLPSQRPVLGQRWLPFALAALGGWLALSLAWTVDVPSTLEALWQWFAVMLLLVVVVTTMAHPRALRMLAGAFVAGAVLSVVAGAAVPEVGTGPEGRFLGASGDPNLLAAGLVPAAVLALGFIAGGRGAWRWASAAALPVLAAGLVASGSRGGLVAAVATALATALVAHRRSAAITAVALVVVATGALAVAPAWDRNDEVGAGSGRSDLWTVAWHVAADHPVAGVGLAAYEDVAPAHVREVGQLRAVELIAAKPQEVHNMYLQMLAETGAIGLTLLLAVVVGCAWAAWRAARLLAAAADHAQAALATAVVLATWSMLVSGLFVSHAVDRRLWVLLAMGPALLAAARVTPAAGHAGR